MENILEIKINDGYTASVSINGIRAEIIIGLIAGCEATITGLSHSEKDRKRLKREFIKLFKDLHKYGEVRIKEEEQSNE